MTIKIYHPAIVGESYYVAFTKALGADFYVMKLVNETSKQIHVLCIFSSIRLDDVKEAIKELREWKYIFDIKYVVWGLSGSKHLPLKEYLKRYSKRSKTKYIRLFKYE